MKKPSIQAVFLGTALVLLSGAAQAQEQAQDVPLPPVKQSGNVSYLSGGVPDEQLEAIEQARPSYPLVIELYQKAGPKSEYTADAEIRIKNSKDEIVVDDKSEGPYFLVRTPPGTYEVEATLDGKSITRRAVVPAKGSRRLMFVFPEAKD